MGSVKSTTVEPMNVFRVAVLKGAVSVIMAHNHPSGELRPSESDKDLTDRLIQVGRILNIKVIEHMIISIKSYMSFVDTGLLAELEESDKWVPAYELIERIRKEEKKIREEAIKIEKEKAKEAVKNAERKKAIEMAKRMKDKGELLDKIIDYTGLTKEEIEKIKIRGNI